MKMFYREQLEMLDENNLMSIILEYQERIHQLQSVIGEQSVEIERLTKQATTVGEKRSRNEVLIEEEIKQSNTKVTQISVEEMRAYYRTIRKAVYEQATKPVAGSENTWKENQEKLKRNIIGLSNDANLKSYQGDDEETAKRIWHHLWTKNRYAGIRSTIAGKEINDIQAIFDDYEAFCDSSWDLESKRYEIMKAGDSVRDFLNRTGQFKGCQTVGNIPKLSKIILVARRLKAFMDEKRPEQSVLDFVTDGHSLNDVWLIHQHLLDIGYGGHLTALHFMMDLGFQVIKPDIMISRIFLQKGWFHQATNMPDDLSLKDLEGKGKYGSRYLYTKPGMYRSAIDLARKIVEEIDQEALKQDIGWVTDNPIREFDIFTVHYAQVPDKDFGIEQRLFKK